MTTSPITTTDKLALAFIWGEQPDVDSVEDRLRVLRNIDDDVRIEPLAFANPQNLPGHPLQHLHEYIEERCLEHRFAGQQVEIVFVVSDLTPEEFEQFSTPLVTKLGVTFSRVNPAELVA